MQVRLRFGDGKTLVVRYILAEQSDLMVPSVDSVSKQPKVLFPPWVPASKPVIVLVEAVPSRAEDLASSLLEVGINSGCRCGLVSLDPLNRLGARYGCTTKSPVRYWKHAASELLVQQGQRCVIAAPEAEEDLEPSDIVAVIQKLREQTDVVIIDLGCRWAPFLFKPAFHHATAIWIVTRTGQWAGAEMRLEQAELSGWTDMKRLRLIVVGEQLTVPPHLPVAGVLRDPANHVSHEFVASEVGRGLR